MDRGHWALGTQCPSHTALCRKFWEGSYGAVKCAGGSLATALGLPPAEAVAVAAVMVAF